MTNGADSVPRTAPRTLTLTVNDTEVRVPEGSSILDVCTTLGIDTPTLCFAENLTPVNACRVCVVELEGSRTLVPACARAAADGMRLYTDTERVRHSRRLVLELLGSSVDLSCGDANLERWQRQYGVDAARFGPAAPDAAPGEREHAHAGHHAAPDGKTAATVGQPPKIQDDLYIRDYKRCILCYKCVEACGEDAQNTFAIAVAGRGFDARISTEFDQPLPESACVYCGNCIGVCPTGALMFKSEYDHRERGTWDPSAQTVTRTVCPYCGVGCNLELHVQEQEIVKVTSPADHQVTSGHLCIKGRFGFQFVQNRPAQS